MPVIGGEIVARYFGVEFGRAAATAEAAAANLQSMKFLARLATGQIALWRTFWLVGTPLALVWDLTGICMVFGFGVEEPLLAGSIIALFALASLLTPFAAVAIWRSASNYPRETWRQTLLAITAKLSAAISGLIGVLSVIGLLYLAYEFLSAILASD
jgi:hypothetical protein